MYLGTSLMFFFLGLPEKNWEINLRLVEGFLHWATEKKTGKLF